jgi:4-aminobutyrate aminotransferase-like enzyme
MLGPMHLVHTWGPVADRAMACGLSWNIVNIPGMGGVFRLAPSLIILPEEIEEGLKIMDEAFAHELGTLGVVD